MQKTKFLLTIFLIINFSLNIYGNNWGLPSRWHSDEKVTNVLHMIDKHSVIDEIEDFYEPTGYQMFLLIWFVPFFTWLKLSRYPLDKLKEAASVSWFHMARLFPDFATHIYIYARILSAVLGTLTVYLIYLLGKEIYNKEIGLFSAAFLSVCMGLIGVNHLAKYTSFLNFLIVLTLLLSVRGLVYLAFFTAGLAMSLHLNAQLLLIPLILTLIFNFINLRHLSFTALKSIILYISGIIIGTPSMIPHFSDYLLKFRSLSESVFLRNESQGTHPIYSIFYTIFVRTINYFFEICSINGILIFILILIGIFITLSRWRKISKKEIIYFSFIIPYYLIMMFFLSSTTGEQKFIISIIPLIILFAGKAMYELINIRILPEFIKYSFFSIVLLYSFAYSFKGDLVFAKQDTRYQSTKWIFENVPKGLKIEMFNQIHYVCSDEVIDDYEVIYLGRSSRDFKGKLFFKWNTVEGRNEYLRYINQYGSSSDYIIIDLDDIKRIYSSTSTYMFHLPGLRQYLKDLFENKKNFILVKVFKSKNQPVASKIFKGVFYPSSLWWDPIPVSGEVSPTIYIFKNMKKN